MDRIKEGANVISQINKHKKGSITDAELINSVNSFFEMIKNFDLSQSDLLFLKHIFSGSRNPSLL